MLQSQELTTIDTSEQIGRPVISADIGGKIHYLPDGKTFLLIKPFIITPNGEVPLPEDLITIWNDAPMSGVEMAMKILQTYIGVTGGIGIAYSLREKLALSRRDFLRYILFGTSAVAGNCITHAFPIRDLLPHFISQVTGNDPIISNVAVDHPIRVLLEHIRSQLNLYMDFTQGKVYIEKPKVIPFSSTLEIDIVPVSNGDITEKAYFFRPTSYQTIRFIPAKSLGPCYLSAHIGQFVRLVRGSNDPYYLYGQGSGPLVLRPKNTVPNLADSLTCMSVEQLMSHVVIASHTFSGVCQINFGNQASTLFSHSHAGRFQLRYSPSAFACSSSSEPLGYTSYSVLAQILGEWSPQHLKEWKLTDIIKAHKQYPDIFLQIFTSLVGGDLDSHEANQRVLRFDGVNSFSIDAAHTAFGELSSLLSEYALNHRESTLRQLMNLTLVRMATVMHSDETSVPRNQQTMIKNQTFSGMVISEDGKVFIPFAMNDLARIGYTQIRELCMQYVKTLSHEIQDKLGNFCVALGDIHDGGGVACFV